MKRYIFIYGLIFLFSSTIIHGQATTVSGARNLPRDSWVVLTGNIINAWSGNYYTFRDSTGEILVEIENSVWRGLSVDISDTVVVMGEVRMSSGQVSIRVRAIAGSGETISAPGQGVMVRQPISVSEARVLPRNSWVILRGNIVNVLPGGGGNRFIFRDSTGDITIEIERDVWRGLFVDVSDRVEISGELRINSGQVSIRVRAIRRI